MSDLDTGAAPAATEAPAIAEEGLSGIEATMAEVYEKNNPPREGNGQFKGTAVEAVQAESAESEPAEQVSEQEPVVEAKEPDKPAIQRPQSWSSDVDELWATLPPKAQEIIAKRESEAHKRITELGEVAKTAEPIKDVLEPLQRASARMGLPPGEGLKLLLAADDYLARDPVAAIQWLAQQSGVDLSRFGQSTKSEQAESAPEVSALNQKIAHLERMLSDTSYRIQQREQHELQTQTQSLESLVNEFAKGKDYWPEIEAEVVAQIRAIKMDNPSLDPKATLEKAHERALKLNDDVRNRLTEAKRKEEEVKKAADTKRKAEEAKRLASMNVRSVDGKAPKAPRKSLEEEMAEVYDRVARA
jgi:valyl-tRNA synthetase